jgi:hypothetical protein
VVEATFFLDDGEVDALRGLDPDRDWRELQRGERAWVLQTYLRLARAGYPVRLASRLPESGVVVFHAKDRRALPLRRRPRGGSGLVFVAVRGDVSQAAGADFEIVQNRSSADGPRRFFIPHWPQPGLLPRDAARGTRLARIAYKGFDRNLHPWFRSAGWRSFLGSHGIEWVVDSVPFAEGGTRGEALEWPDFRSVDAVLAVRPASCPRRDSKPATKLYNAWLAGVPALLSPDVAFRELRRSPLDYLEAEGPAAAERGVRRLLAEPDLYRRMVANGRARAAEFSTGAILARWLELLEETLPERLARGGGRGSYGTGYGSLPRESSWRTWRTRSTAARMPPASTT